MPKLVLDEETLQVLASKLSKFPIHAAPGGGMLEPGVFNLVEDAVSERPWKPGDQRTRLLALGGEACQDIVYYGEHFEPSSARRTLKNLSVTVCSLMDVVVALQKALNADEFRKTRTAWPLVDQNTYVDVGKRLRKVHSKGPVRTVRHKIGAHLDLDAFDMDVQAKPNDVLSAMGDALVLLLLTLNHGANAFSWIRELGASEDGSLLVETMFDYPVCVRWMTDSGGNVLRLAAATLAADPRHDISARIFKGIETYNYLVRAAETDLPSIQTRDMADVLREEGRELPSTVGPSKRFLLARATSETSSD